MATGFLSVGFSTLGGILLASQPRFEYRRWPPRRPFFGGTHAAIASSLSQIVTSPRLLRPRSYSLQFRILYFFLYWRLTRLDFAATMTLPPDLYDGLDPTPAASVLAYTDSCTNAQGLPARVEEDQTRLAGPALCDGQGRVDPLSLQARDSTGAHTTRTWVRKRTWGLPSSSLRLGEAPAGSGSRANGLWGLEKGGWEPVGPSGRENRARHTSA